MLLGSWLGGGKGKLTEKSLVLGPGCALLIGLGLWLWWPITPGLSLRLQVGGAFMPPQPGYLLWGAGMFLLCWVTTRPAAGAAGFVPLRVFGRYPLVGYGLHLAFIQLMRYRFGKFFFTRWQFFLILALWLGALYLLLVGIAHCTGWVRSNKRFCFQLKWLARLNAGAMVCRQVRKRESWP
ncbi:MAG: hypothetical protein D6715_08160 [Calditrichaeota bacterium]|nr:MAG: hypothetical protein D6715_08160 [Calditrichota bacterium]